MANWSPTIRACKTLWTTLFQMHQLVTNFDDTGNLKISDLTFYNSLSSAALRQQNATILADLADQLDNTFITGRGATYKAGADRTKAMQTMVDILTDGTKMVSDLAVAVDGCYQFV